MGFFSNIGKTFKSILDSDLGKVAVTAAAAYVGGGMLGAWETPFDSINGMLQAETGGSTSSSLGEMGTSLAGAEKLGYATDSAQGSDLTDPMKALGPFGQTNSAPATGQTGFQEGVPSAPRLGQDVVADMDASSQGPGMPGLSQNQPWGTLAAQKVADFFKGDLAKAAMVQQAGAALKGAFQPTPERMARAQYDARRTFEQQRAADRNVNYNVAPVQLPRPPLIG